jgi:lipopolysaccharide transport system ATP-binding protein
MSDIAIRVEGLGKRYRIGAAAERHRDLRDAVTAAVKAPFRNLARLRSLSRFGEDGEEENTVWALKDVSFEVKQGEVLGIIGRNGAGKSTLLKVLSRITEPTTGRVQLHGRVGALLEVGTGFHPELTGRENVYLNGSILGMDKKYIDRKFDEIVEFSGVEKFIDTPVKRYSSGMYLRLAFSVAAHLEPEILVVDEVLAVGDAAFQKKCLGKMGDVATEGRTVLFVSHNMAAIQRLCTRGLVLQSGTVKFWGDIQGAINCYVQDVQTARTIRLEARRDRQGSQRLKFTHVAFFDGSGKEQQQVVSGQDVFIRFYYVSDGSLRAATTEIAFNVRSAQGHLLTNLNSRDVDRSVMDLHPAGFFECLWPRFNLRSGSYDCALYCAVNGEVVDWLQSAFTLEVEDGDFFYTGRITNRDQGDFLVPYDWSSHLLERTDN